MLHCSKIQCIPTRRTLQRTYIHFVSTASSLQIDGMISISLPLTDKAVLAYSYHVEIRPDTVSLGECQHWMMEARREV